MAGRRYPVGIILAPVAKPPEGVVEISVEDIVKPDFREAFYARDSSSNLGGRGFYLDPTYRWVIVADSAGHPVLMRLRK